MRATFDNSHQRLLRARGVDDDLSQLRRSVFLEEVVGVLDGDVGLARSTWHELDERLVTAGGD